MKENNSVSTKIISYKTIINLNEGKKQVVNLEIEVCKKDYRLYQDIERTLNELNITPGRNRVVYQLVLLESIKLINRKKDYQKMIKDFQNPTSNFYKKVEDKYKIENSYDVISDKYNKYATTPGVALFGMAQYIIVENPKKEDIKVNNKVLEKQRG